MKGLTVAFFVLAGLLVQGHAAAAQEPEPVVHALFFYSSSCPHCHQVINETLIPMQEQYGSSLVILALETSQGPGNALYWEALRHFEIPQENWVVPILIVDDEIMVGGLEIPQRFPPLVDAALAGGGIDLPDFPALMTFLEEQGMVDHRFPGRRIALQDPPIGVRTGAPAGDPEAAQPPPQPAEEGPVPDNSGVSVDSLPEAAADTAEEGTPVDAEEEPASDVQPTPGDPAASDPETAPDEAEGTPVAPPQETGSPSAPPRERGGEAASPMDLGQAARAMESRSMWDNFNMDRAGNSASVLVLLFMIVSLALRGWPPRVRGKVWPAWVVPVLVVVGVGVATYLSYIEITHAEAVCGPVGDCNTVNQSEYATLFGILPVGVLGLMGYAVILVLWAWGLFGGGDSAKPAHLGLWGAALFGTVFSVYLTFLEPFVIGATCAWCLTSAVVMTLLLWAGAPAARDAWPGRARVEEAHER